MTVAVWILRLLTGAVFLVSGWAKAVDPAGFIIKVGEYLAVWGLSVPHEAIVAGCMSLAAVEFTTGILIATGCLKRVAVWLAAAMMLFMLPLTAYIFVADPVADCGCFGDLIILSNGATFAKNIVIAAMIVLLMLWNRRVRGLYPAPVQWLVATAAMAFALFLSLMGYLVQPVVDFRPFRLGTTMFHPSEDLEEASMPRFEYERNGERRFFPLDSIPGEDWTFVRAVESTSDVADIAVRDDEGIDVGADILSDSPQCWLIVPDPGVQFLSRSHLVSELYNYLNARNIDFIALVGNRGAGYDYWIDMARPTFPVYSAEDTALEQLARGSAAIVYTRGGRIVWKRTLGSLPDNLISSVGDEDPDLSGNALDTVEPVDDGRLAWASALVLAAVLVALYLLGLSPRLLRLVSAKKSPTQSDDNSDNHQ